MRTTHPLHLEPLSPVRSAPREPRRSLLGLAFAAWIVAFVVIVTLAAKVGADQPQAPQTGPADHPTPAEATPAPVQRPPASPSAAAEKATPIFPPGFSPASASSAAKQVSPGGATNSASNEGLMSMAVPLAVVVGVIFIVAAIFQRVLRAGGHLTSGVRAPSGIMEMLGRYPVGRGQNLLLIKLDQRVLLIGQTLPSRGSAGSLSTLSELADGEDVASILLKVSESESAGPAAKFNKLLREHEGEDVPARGARALAKRLFGGSGAVVWDESLLKQDAPPVHPAGEVQERLARLKAAARTRTPAAGGGLT